MNITKREALTRRATLYKVRDLLQESKNDSTKKYEPIGALIRFSDELRSEDDVIWVCKQLELGGHQHPFGLLELTSNNALDGLWLSFLQEARAASLDIKRFSSAVSFAAKNWSHKDRYLKGRSEYANWEEEHPRPDGIKLLPRIDVEEPESPEQTRENVCLKLTRYLHAGNLILDKCRALSVVEKKEAEDWANDIAALVRLIGGEVALGKFLDQSRIPPANDPPNHPNMEFFMKQKAIFDFLYPRCYRLRKFIDDIESGKIVPFSKPFLS